MACEDARCDFKPMRMKRRPLGPQDIEIDMKYCGVCHSDLHIAADHMAKVATSTQYPCVPGHELAGVCIAVGSEVTKIQVGDKVGVGCMVDACLECKACNQNDEQKCKKQTATYNGKAIGKRSATYPEKRLTIGGYCTKMVVHEHFAIKIPEEMPLEYAGPIMCAGITMYEPLKHHGVKAGTRVGIVGLGGLGVMGIKLAHAMGCEVTAISRSYNKKDQAMKHGAVHYVASTDRESMKEAKKSLDLILNTIPTHHAYSTYQSLLAKGGKHVLLGLHAGFGGALFANKIKNASVKNSMIGGIKNTQEVVDLCAKESIYPHTEVVPVQRLNEIYTILDSSNDDGKRYVLDIAGTLTEETLKTYSADPPTLSPNTTQMHYPSVIKELFRILFFH
mmetsp:Transcript_2958/g.3380  ORF Transcript_2958/g.3380 Transcript_2958/m.3380 type:complete len:391 (-) Transcript_2958:175-1347(-)